MTLNDHVLVYFLVFKVRNLTGIDGFFGVMDLQCLLFL